MGRALLRLVVVGTVVCLTTKHLVFVKETHVATHDVVGGGVGIVPVIAIVARGAGVGLSNAVTMGPTVVSIIGAGALRLLVALVVPVSRLVGE